MAASLAKRRQTEYRAFEWCEDGHRIRYVGEPVMKTEYLNSCGHWVPEDANYCGYCPGRLTDEPGGPVRLRPEGAG